MDKDSQLTVSTVSEFPEFLINLMVDLFISRRRQLNIPNPVYISQNHKAPKIPDTPPEKIFSDDAVSGF